MRPNCLGGPPPQWQVPMWRNLCCYGLVMKLWALSIEGGVGVNFAAITAGAKIDKFSGYGRRDH